MNKLIYKLENLKLKYKIKREKLNLSCLKLIFEFSFSMNSYLFHNCLQRVKFFQEAIIEDNDNCVFFSKISV